MMQAAITAPEAALDVAKPEAKPEANPVAKPLRPPSRWHDPLQLIEHAAPERSARIVLWTIAVLCLLLIVWACLGQLDIIASAEGKLASQTLLKVVQPSEAGVVKQLLVAEGDSVKAGQVLARLDTTLAKAERSGVQSALASQQMQMRRLQAALQDQAMSLRAGDDAVLFAQVQSQAMAQRRAFADSVEQERALLLRAENELRSAQQILHKLEQTLPSYNKAAESYAKLEKEGFFGNLASQEKQREALEKSKDLEAQRASVAALSATITAQQKKISQLQSAFRADLEKELAEVRAKVQQLQPEVDKTNYKEGLMELRAPQDGIIKDLATTTVGAVVQPGSVVLTLVPKGEQLFADVAIKNEDVGFVQEGQSVQIKLATYPFQRYGMLHGKVVHLSADATEVNKSNATPEQVNASASYKARVALDSQTLQDAQGKKLVLAPGMQVVAEIHQGKRSVMAYLLSPVQKAVGEAARER